MERITIPHSLQITMDDVGWFCGTDDRKQFGPARSGMPRRHCARDYEAIEELGKRLDMKINCAFILGEWDPDNRLRSIPSLSKYGENWDNAAFFPRKEAERIVEILNASPHIDMAVHGLLHNNYEPGSQYGNTDYFYKKDDRYFRVAEAQIRRRLDAFFDLVQYHGIQKRSNSFIAPNFVYEWDFLARILKDYGIRYVSTVFDRIENLDGRTLADMDNGLVTMDRNFNEIPWYEVGSDPRDFAPVRGIFGCHWPNILAEDPDGFPRVLDTWEEYFLGCGEVFGIVLSKDIGFSADQLLFKRFAVAEPCGEGLQIDVSNVPDWPTRTFCVSSRTPLESWSGCDVKLWQQHEGFANYLVTPKAEKLTIQ